MGLRNINIGFCYWWCFWFHRYLVALHKDVKEFLYLWLLPYCNNWHLGKRVRKAVKRIDVGGKLLTNHLKEIISYRYTVQLCLMELHDAMLNLIFINCWNQKVGYLTMRNLYWNCTIIVLLNNPLFLYSSFALFLAYAPSHMLVK